MLKATQNVHAHPTLTLVIIHSQRKVSQKPKNNKWSFFSHNLASVINAVGLENPTYFGAGDNSLPSAVFSIRPKNNK